MEGDTSTVTLGVVAMGPRSVSTSSTSATAREVIPVERPQREGSSARGAGAEPPWTLIRIGTDIPWIEWADPQNLRALPFILDDPAVEKE
jgi:hypothetical protein